MPATTTASFSADRITFRYGDATVLDGVSFAAEPGAFLAVVGPNGAGKTTLLRLLAGELRPQSGSVALDGEPVHAQPAAALARQRAVLAQGTRVTFDFTVQECVQLGRLPFADTPSAAHDAAVVASAIEAMQLVALRDRLVPTLSGGEQQRVHLARTFAQATPSPQADAPRGQWLLLDEPVAALDLCHQHGTLGRVRDWAQRGGGAVAVLHDLNLALRYADAVLVLDAAGTIAAHGALPGTLRADVIARVFDVTASLVRDDDGRAVIVTRPVG